MKTRIKIELPDGSGDVKVRAQVKHGFFSGWTNIGFGWAMSGGDLNDKINYQIEKMKQQIDAYRSSPRFIDYPEEQ